MSNVYIVEPPTKGKVVFSTTYGDIDIELWPKEAPKTARNFVQLCLEGYYNGTLFHRVIKDFMIQAGDPTGTGEGGESIYGGYFPDEFHSRLRFKHRGLIGSANAGTPDTNNSQFFVTLDRCDWLDKKNTIFGKVTGDTIYNVLKIGGLEVDADDRPLEPPKIISTEVLWNPFDDLEPRPEKLAAQKSERDEEKKKPRKKEKKNLALLSFGEDAAEEDETPAAVKPKIRSAHDILDERRLLRDEEAEGVAELEPKEADRRKALKSSVRQALGGSSKVSESKPDEGGEDETDIDFDERMRRQVLDRRRKIGVPESEKRAERPKIDRKVDEARPPAESRDSDSDSDRDSGEDGRRKMDPLKLRRRKEMMGSAARAEMAEAKNEDLQMLTPLEQQRLKYKQKKRAIGSREAETLAKLAKFKGFLSGAAKAPPGEPAGKKIALGKEVGEDEDDPGWINHSLEFAPNGGTKANDAMARNEDPDQYSYVDPLAAKGKDSKMSKLQAQMKKRSREWGQGAGPRG